MGRKSGYRRWRPFVEQTLAGLIESNAHKMSLDAIRARWDEQQANGCKIYYNDRFIVHVTPMPPQPDAHWPEMIELSIRRQDNKPIHNWRDLQRIKNMVLGPEYEAVELYPREDRLVDTANQYWLYALANTSMRFPFGMSQRSVTALSDGDTGCVQEPFQAEDSHSERDDLMYRLACKLHESGRNFDALKDYGIDNVATASDDDLRHAVEELSA